MVPGILLIGLIATGKQKFVATGCVSPKEGANLREDESIRSTHEDECFLHPTDDRNTAVRYAYGAHGNGSGIGSGSVLQICVPAVVASYGAEAVRPVNRKNERADLNIAEDSRAAFFARKDFETLMLVHNLSTVDGHILAHLDVADLTLGEGGGPRDKPTLTTDEVLLGSSVNGMRKHNMIAALAFQKREIYQQNVRDCAKQNSLLVSTDGSGIPGEDRGILTNLDEKHEHVGDKHDSTYALALEETRKDTVKSMQTPGIANKLMWIYWHHDPDSQCFGNWVLLHVTTHESTGMTRAMVHEVMHDTTAVKGKKTASRMRTSGETARFECVHLGNIAAIAQTKTGVFVSAKPLAFYGCGRGGVWDLHYTSRVWRANLGRQAMMHKRNLTCASTVWNKLYRCACHQKSIMTHWDSYCST